MPATTQPPLAKVAAAGAKGCLSDGAAGRGRAPAYDLSGAERAALLEFMKSDVAAGLAADVPAEFATRNLRALNCAGCHNLDGRVSSWKKLDEECRQLRSLLPPKEHVEGEPVPDAPVPALTWQGEKLRTAWMTEFIAGRVEDKPRWWLIGVMPGFTHHAPTLALGLGQQHGFGPKDPEDPKPDPARIAVGEKLLGMDGGFNCITCHDVGEKEATAVFEAPGINLALSAERLRKGHFHRWLLNPNRLDPETKMPKYADGDGMTQLTEHFNGKAEDQFEAIREYLNTLKK
jgi:mono/diheme cytochrome c family protein